MTLPEIPAWLMAAACSGLVSLGLLFGALAGLYAPLNHHSIVRPADSSRTDNALVSRA